MSTPRPIALGVLVVALVLGFAPGFSSGPFSGLSGAPNDSDCTICHADFPVNSGVGAGFGTFEITAPETNVGLARNIPITVTFPTTMGRRHGFELTARDGDDQGFTISPAGVINITDPVATQNAFGDPNYATHTAAGNIQTGWSMELVPDLGLPGGPIILYAAGNAANNDFSPSGDYIFTTSRKVYQAEVSSPSTTWPLGATQVVDINAPTQPNTAYALAISDDTTAVSLGGPFEVPLNPFTAITDFAWDPAAASIFQNFIGFTDPTGVAQAQVNLPAVPSLSGLSFHFAYVTFDATALPAFVPTEVSNRLTVTLQ